MAFQKKAWLNVPDPLNPPEPPEGQDSLAVFDADNMNRIEGGIESAHKKIDKGLSEAFEKIALANVGKLVVQKITTSCTWTAPKAASQLFKVFCVGGGGSAGALYYRAVGNTYPDLGGGGGGGGCIEISDVEIEAGTEIEIICGAGGKGAGYYQAGQSKPVSTDGGDTLFGDMLVAKGGEAGESATPSSNGNGGNGGSGGGGGGNDNSTPGNGGNGGLYGGGGGGAGMYGASTVGQGGTSDGCGNGGTLFVSPDEGKIFDGGFLDYFFGIDSAFHTLYKNGNKGGDGNGVQGGGGGGNGGNGGWGNNYLKEASGAGRYYACAAGGGGGFGGNGGNGGVYSGGGGGGYFGNGASPASNKYGMGYNGGGGGGFFCDGSPIGGGGGFFSGGNGYDGGNGGVLIMYIKEDE